MIEFQRTLVRRLWDRPYEFNFFQAVRLLQLLDEERQPVGRAGSPRREAVRFRSAVTLAFPPATVLDLLGTMPGETPPDEPVARTPTVPGGPPVPILIGPNDPPVLIQPFLGLIGPSGVLPRHYTEWLIRHLRDFKGNEKAAARDWFDLFVHRFTTLLYRSWEKYRYVLAYERGEQFDPVPDPFTLALLSIVGLGTPGLRERLTLLDVETVRAHPTDLRSGPAHHPRYDGRSLGVKEDRPKPLARVPDLGILSFAGLFASTVRTAVGLERLLSAYFGVPVTLEPFRGQWLSLEPEDRSILGTQAWTLGVDVFAGERVWDMSSLFRLRIGPLSGTEFSALLPVESPRPYGKTFHLLCHLTKLYAGPGLDFEVQLVVRHEEVPVAHLEGVLPEDDPTGSRLGRNAWVASLPFADDTIDAIFPGEAPFLFAEALPGES
ncbi:MAG: hypothetical protein GC206_10530 [Alphaproteobacteria bacterium]|nr:hypothetical protein [Alphaproteobacteria bacterium]